MFVDCYPDSHAPEDPVLHHQHCIAMFLHVTPSINGVSLTTGRRGKGFTWRYCAACILSVSIDDC